MLWSWSQPSVSTHSENLSRFSPDEPCTLVRGFCLFVGFCSPLCSCCYCYLLPHFKLLRAGTLSFLNRIKNSRQMVYEPDCERSMLGEPESGGVKALSCPSAQSSKWLLLFSGTLKFSFCLCTPASSWEIRCFLAQIYLKCLRFLNINHLPRSPVGIVSLSFGCCGFEHPNYLSLCIICSPFAVSHQGCEGDSCHGCFSCCASENVFVFKVNSWVRTTPGFHCWIQRRFCISEKYKTMHYLFFILK